MNLHLKTYGIGQKSGRISIDSNGISFAEKTLLVDDIQNISSSLKVAREMLYTSINSKITLTTSSDSMTFKFCGTDSMISKRANEVLENFMTIRTAVIQHIGPGILNRMIQRMSGGGDVHIGKFTFNHKGITTKSVMRGELRAGWHEDFEVRPKAKENMFLKCLNFGATSREACDHWEIYYHNQAIGKMINLGEFSFDDSNGCMIPFLISYIKEIQ